MKKTMTVGELKQYLENFPADMRVLAAWEGVFAPVLPENIEVNIPKDKGGFKIPSAFRLIRFDPLFPPVLRPGSGSDLAAFVFG